MYVRTCCDNEQLVVSLERRWNNYGYHSHCTQLVSAKLLQSLFIVT